MNRSPDIESAAAEWVVRRDRGEGDPAQRQAFERWLAADSRHRKAYLELQQGWQQADGLRAWVPRQGHVNPRVLKECAPPRARRSRRMHAIAATFLATVVAAALYTVRLSPDTYTTEVGGYQRIVLTDGSTLQLNTDTRVKVRFGDRRREVRLVRGEAYLQVAGDSLRPFRVFAGDREVRVLGTAFAVRRFDEQTLEVTVTAGKVSLPGENGAVLTAFQSVRADSRGTAVHTLSQTEIDRRLAWQSGELSFQGENLAQVVAEFNRYNRRQLVLADPALTRREVGGDFRATDLDSFIAALQSSFAVRADVRADSIRLFARTE